MTVTAAQIAAIEADVSTAITDLSTATTDLATATADVAAVTTALSGIGTALSGISTALSGAETTINQALTALEALTPDPVVAPPPAPTGPVPNAPASLNIPTSLVLDEEFATLNLKLWAPRWFGDGAYQQGTIMRETNVSVDANGLELVLAAPVGTAAPTGAIVSSNPNDANLLAVKGGFAIAPTPTAPVYMEVEATLPGTASGVVANWPAFWQTGQVWPEDGEIDDMEGLSGWAAWHTHWGTGSTDLGGQGANVFSTPGKHTFGSLWTTTGVTFVYDGVVVGTHEFTAAGEAASMASPKYIVLENSLPNQAGVDLLAPATVTVRYVRVWQ